MISASVPALTPFSHELLLKCWLRQPLVTLINLDVMFITATENKTKTHRSQVVVVAAEAHTFNSGTQEAEEGRSL